VVRDTSISIPQAVSTVATYNPAEKIIMNTVLASIPQAVGIVATR